VFVIVTAPVAPETEMPEPAMFEVTPVLVTLPAEYERPEEKVVVATHEGMPETSESTWPFVPEEVVESLDVPLPTKSALACTFPHPVPPTLTPMVDEEMSVVPAVSATMTVLGVKEFALVPPFATGTSPPRLESERQVPLIA
jgi:hypothetical protein